VESERARVLEVLQAQLAALTYRGHARAWGFAALLPGFGLCALDQDAGPSALSFTTVLLWVMAASLFVSFDALAWSAGRRALGSGRVLVQTRRPLGSWLELVLLNSTRAAGVFLAVAALWPTALPALAVAWAIRAFAVSAAGVLAPAILQAVRQAA
jgi:hypothetical protein